MSDKQSWCDNPRFNKWFKQADLPTLCLSLRMSLNGSADPWEPREVAQAIEYIQSRMREWEPSIHKIDQKMDDAVYQMCQAAVEQWFYYVPACSGGGCFGGCPHDPTNYQWMTFEPLFKWRDELTDYWGENLVWLLYRMTKKEVDPRLSKELLPLWKAFSVLEDEAQWDYAKEYVISTGWDGKSQYDD
jgi:hypothetical protein